MSRRVKCDRCGEMHDPFYGAHIQRRAGFHDEQHDLCYDCSQELHKWLVAEPKEATDD